MQIEIKGVMVELTCWSCSHYKFLETNFLGDCVGICLNKKSMKCNDIVQDKEVCSYHSDSELKDKRC